MKITQVAVSPQKAGVAIQNATDGSGHAEVVFVDGNGVPTGGAGCRIIEDPDGGHYIQLWPSPGPEWILGVEGDGRIRVNR